MECRRWHSKIGRRADAPRWPSVHGDHVRRFLVADFLYGLTVLSATLNEIVICPMTYLFIIIYNRTRSIRVVVAEWLRHWTCDRRVACSTPTKRKVITLQSWGKTVITNPCSRSTQPSTLQRARKMRSSLNWLR
jgi:hypothetical protein